MWWVKNMVGKRYVGESYAGQKNTGRTITVGEPIQWVNMYVGEHV